MSVLCWQRNGSEMAKFRLVLVRVSKGFGEYFF
jgi:hypothetical protein